MPLTRVKKKKKDGDSETFQVHDDGYFGAERTKKDERF